MTTDPSSLVDSEGEEMSLNKIDAALKSIGISMQDTNGQFRDFDDVIMELAAKWDTLDANSARYIATLMAGNRQQSRFLALVSNYDEYVRTLQIAEDSEGQGAIQYLKTMDSISTKIQELKTAWQQLYASLGIEKVIKGVLDTITKVLKQLSSYNLSGLIASLIQNFITLKKIFKLVFNSGEKQLNTFVEYYNTKKREMENNAIKITLDTSQAEQQADALAARVANAQQGITTTGATNVETSSTIPTSTSLSAQQLEVLSSNATSVESLLQFSANNGGYHSTIGGFDFESALTEDEWNGLLQQWQSSRGTNGDLSFTSFLEGLSSSTQEVTETLSGFAKAKEWISVPKHLSAIATGAQILGSAMQTASLALNPNSSDNYEGNKILSGLGSLFQGVGTGASIGLQVGGPWGALIGGIGGLLVSGFTGAFDTIIDGFTIDYDERRKMLEEEATELTATQTEKKGEESSLKNAIQTYEDLAAKQYDSAEAAEELQEHMNSMAEQYPQLVDYYDEAGNAIIDVQKAEEALAKARYQTTAATADVLKNEVQQKQNDLYELQEVQGKLGKKTNATVKSYEKSRTGTILVKLTDDSEYLSFLSRYESTIGSYTDVKQFLKDLTDGTIYKKFNTNEDYDNFMQAYKAAGLHSRKGSSVNRTIDWGNLLYSDFTDDSGNNVVSLAKEYLQNYAEVVGFSLNGFDLEDPYSLYEAMTQFYDFVNASVTDAEDILSTSSDLLTSNLVNERISLQAIIDTDITEAYEEYSSLMGSVGLEIVKKTLENQGIDIVEAQNESSEDHSAYLSAINAAADAVAAVDAEMWEAYAEVYSDFDFTLSADETKQKLQKAGITDENILNAAVAQYESQTESARSRVTAAASVEGSYFSKGTYTSANGNKVNYSTLFGNMFNNYGEYELATGYADIVVDFINTVEDYAEQGLTERADALMASGSWVFDKIAHMSSSGQEKIFSIVSKIDWTDASSIDTAIEAMEDFNTDSLSADDKTRWDQALAELKIARENFLFNVETELNLAIDAYKEAVEGMEDLQKYAENGMSWNDVEEQFTKLKASGIEGTEDLTLDEFATFDPLTNSYILTKEALELLYQKQKEDAEKYRENAEAAWKLAEGISTDGLDNLSTDAETGALDLSNTGYEDKEKQQLQEWWEAWQAIGGTENEEYDSFSSYVKAMQADAEKSYETSIELMDAFNAEYSQIAAENARWAAELESKSSKTAKFLEYASKTSLSVGDIEEYATFLGKSANDFLNALINKGVVSYNYSTDQYDIVDFDAYWVALGNELNKTTDAYLEAHANWVASRISEEEKKAEAYSKELDSIFGGRSGDLLDLTYLNDLLGEETLKNLGFELEDGLYKIGDKINYSALFDEIEAKGEEAFGNSLTTIQDKIVSLFNDWAEMLDKGLNGTLSFENADILKSQFGLTDADFTETANGLKLSKRAAYGLLAEIRKVDATAGKIATTKLAESLAKNDEQFDDIYSVMRKIDELNKEIADPDISNDRREELEAELAVAKEIEQTLKEADNTFNFMDRDLPSGFDDPMSAWEGVGDAMEVLNGDDFAAGKMNFTDFYNMVDFMGDDLVATAFGFEKDAFTAADLIEAGAHAIKMVDGEAYVDLSSLGDNFNISADGMKEGITQGIHTIAESQIEMLDAAIGILETIVAMEDISNVDTDKNGILDFDEIFLGDESTGSIYGFQEEWRFYVANVKSALEKAGIDLESISIDGKALSAWLESDYDTWKNLGINYEKYIMVMNALVKASQSQDFDANDIPGIFESLKLGEEVTIDLDDGTKYTINPDGTTIEWKAGETTLIYTDRLGVPHTLNTDDSQEEIAAIENENTVKSASGDSTKTYNAETMEIKVAEDFEFEYFVEHGEDGDVWYYEGNQYESDDDILEAIEKKTNLENTGAQKTGNTQTISGEIYTEYKLANGGTIFLDKNGNPVSADELTKRSLEEAGVDSAVLDTPINVNLSIVGTTAEEAASIATSLSSIQTSIAGMSELDFSSASNFIDSLSTVGDDVSGELAAIKAELEALTEQGYVIDLTYNITTNTDNTGNQSYSLNVNDNGASSTLATLATSLSTVNSTATALKNTLDNIPDNSANVSNTSKAMEKLPDKSKNVDETRKAMNKLPNKSAAVKATANAMDKLKSKTISASINVSVSVSGSAEAKATSNLSNGLTTKYSSSGNNSLYTKMTEAKGNAAFAKGTLMGELGPELVVSNGRYFTVGNNGAEFVDLADDAIVFNHLQTKKLLSSGSSGRGTPVTNEKKATSLATGNAMASASETLAELKQIKAMWEALLEADAKTLGSKAGSGGGGGGGGGNNDVAGYEYDLERWYNLLRQIAKLEQQITYEQAKRENMQSGYKYVDSLEKELDLLEKQLKAEKELASLQYDYYLKRMKDVNSSAYGKIFTYDSEGLMQYVDGKNRGLDALATLQATDENGVLKMSAKEQLNYITKTLGISLSDLKYKSDGSEAEEDKDKVQVFFDNVDSLMDELDELYDSYHEHAEKLEDLTTSQNEILQEYVDNQRSLEDKLVQAIEDREQAIIDKLTDEKEAIENASQEYIDGLNEALSKEQELYSKNETDTETAKLQRRLAILQRSGGSASEIKSLQDQIDSRLKDAYFQAQQDQIEAIQDASNKQLEKLQDQIDLMTETLEYQKENGLLWQEVYEMMNEWSPEQMLQFIEQYTKSYKENSPLENSESSKETLKEAEIYAAKRDKDTRDAAWSSYYANAAYDSAIKEANKDAAQSAYNDAYTSGGREAAEAAANKIFEEASKKPEETIPDSSPSSSSSSTSSSTTESKTSKGYVKTNSGKGLNVRAKPNTSSSILTTIPNGKKMTIYDDYENSKWYKVSYGGKTGYAYKQYIKKYAQGGLVDFTGPAWVDGTKSKPEAFLNAEDTAMLKSKIFSNSDGSLKTLVAALEEITKGTSSYQGESGGIVIENATVNIQPGTISNDYDARRAGELALEEMVKIARKTTNRTIRR